MCRLTSRNGAPAAGLIAGLAGFALITAAAAQTAAPVPDFSSNQAAWIATSNDFIPPTQGRAKSAPATACACSTIAAACCSRRK